MAADGDGVALTDLLGAYRVLLVADAGLGTINAVRLTLEALGPARPVLVVLNRYDADNPLHERNRSWLTDRNGLDVVTTPAAAATWLLA
jgi:dethiobiotin synthetase